MTGSYIDIHTHSASNTPNVIEIVSIMAKDVPENAFIDKFSSVGIHPWDISNGEENLYRIDFLAKKGRVVAIGECGLDKLATAPMGEQVELFKRQMVIARKYKLPLIIHCVRGYDVLLSMKRSLRTMKMVVHGFRGKEQLAKQLLECGLYISFGEALFSQTSIQKLVMTMPIDRLFLETDESAISIIDIYQLVANLRGISVEELKQLLYKNYQTLYCKPLL